MPESQSRYSDSITREHCRITDLEKRVDQLERQSLYAGITTIVFAILFAAFTVWRFLT